VRYTLPTGNLFQQSPPDAVCLVRLSAIGDCCHALPVARTIQSAWPDTNITWVIGRTEYQLMQGIEGIEFIVFDKSKGYAAVLDVRRSLHRRHFPVLLHMHASMRANLVARAIDADIRLGFDRARARDYQWLFTNARIPARSGQHVMDGLFGFVETLGITARDMRWDIPVANADRQFAEQVCGSGDPLCVISPCSSERSRNYRNWSAQNFAVLANQLEQRFGARVILTGGATDLELQTGKAIRAAAGANVTSLIDQLEGKGLVQRRPCKDRRVKLIRITPKALKILEKSFPDILEISARLVENITDDEKRTLLRLINKIEDVE